MTDWNDETEVLLFEAIEKYPPYGISLSLNISNITSLLNSRQKNVNFNVKQVYDKINTFFNIHHPELQEKEDLIILRKEFIKKYNTFDLDFEWFDFLKNNRNDDDSNNDDDDDNDNDNDDKIDNNSNNVDNKRKADSIIKKDDKSERNSKSRKVAEDSNAQQSSKQTDDKDDNIDNNNDDDDDDKTKDTSVADTKPPKRKTSSRSFKSGLTTGSLPAGLRKRLRGFERWVERHDDGKGEPYPTLANLMYEALAVNGRTTVDTATILQHCAKRFKTHLSAKELPRVEDAPDFDELIISKLENISIFFQNSDNTWTIGTREQIDM